MSVWKEDELRKLQAIAKKLGVDLKSEAKKCIEVRVSPRLIRRREA